MRIRWSGHVARMGTVCSYKILVGKPEGKRPRGRCRRRCKDNIKINVREIRYELIDWIHLTQDSDQWRAPLKAMLNFRVP